MAGNYKHGMRNTRLYNIWRSMRQRCNNPNCGNYNNYGARGVSVCEEWNHSFMKFYQWAKETGYEETLTIDRIDVNGNYEPSNCRWSTYREQANNKRNGRYVVCNGVSHTLGEWSQITGISIGTLWNRLKCGWDVEEALTIEPFIGRNQFN